MAKIRQETQALVGDVEQLAQEVGHTAKRTVIRVVRNVMDHNVMRNGASLAYYLLFALFPMLIFISNVLGMLDLNVATITTAMSRILPGDIVNLIGTYLEYVAENSSSTLMWFSLVFSIIFPMRAVSGLMDDVRTAYQLGKPKGRISYTIRQLIYTVLLIVVIGLTLLFSTVGQRVLNFLLDLIPDTGEIPVSRWMLTGWQYFRFLLVGVLMFAALGVLYALPQDHRQPVRDILPGVGVALVAWLLVSIIFSFYVENFASYSVIYGTLGAVIVLLMWLYITAVILILGAEFNAALRTVRAENKERETQQNSET